MSTGVSMVMPVEFQLLVPNTHEAEVVETNFITAYENGQNQSGNTGH